MANISSQPNRLRILFIINSLAGGGAERVMTTLLANSGDWTDRFEMGLALLDDDPHAFDLPEWLRVFQLDCNGGIGSSILALRGVVREFDPQVTLSFLTRSNFSAGTIMMARQRPWIISERTSTPAHLGNRIRQMTTKMLMRIVYPRATRVIAVSDGVATSLSRNFGVDPHRMEVIPNPFGLSAIESAARGRNPVSAARPYIIAVGRLVSVKNYRLLIEAFEKSRLPCKLVIAGEGPEREALMRLAAQLGVADRVVMPGWLSNPYPALAEAHVFALSSNVEGFPNALVEALALGIPCVATDCPHGPAEILGGTTFEPVSEAKLAEAGVLTPVGDVDSYAQALRIAADDRFRQRLISAGPQRARRYSAASITARYWSVIERALQE